MALTTEDTGQLYVASSDLPSGRRPQLMAVQPARILSLLFPLCRARITLLLGVTIDRTVEIV